jgi:hypothetical protein
MLTLSFDYYITIKESGDLKLWKYDKIAGYYVFVRSCDKETAENWLKIFQEDEPDEKFVLSKNKPKLPKSILSRL